MRILILSGLAAGVTVSGCGGGAPAATLHAAGSSPAATAIRPTRSGLPPAGAGHASGPVAFANCMRAHGVPSFSDPSSGRGLRFAIPAGANPASRAFQAARAKCQRLLPRGGGGLPGSGPGPSAATMAKLLAIARCMRRHGISEFPDPKTSIPRNPLPPGGGVITDYDGAILIFPSTMNLDAPAYTQALHACGAPPLGLPH